jgi:diaminohydroxyphosphoribosylaminopyrimidine deaminase/5-amino-6-(5-phosphoribosylamino)uracil reductase
MPATPDTDARWMRAALVLASRGLGRVAPNPTVGCVLVADGHVIGRGWTQPGGRPHGERMALDQAGPLARGADAYVTLEPCAHYGKTPPCADALIAAGVARVICPLTDPDPRVAGRGFERLRAAGVAVSVGLMTEDAAAMNVGFFTRLRLGRPHLTLKLAASLDGRIATGSGESQWISGPEARAEAHLLRARSDVILVGSGTAIADDPGLTVRLPGLEDRSPIPVILDSRARTPLTTALVRGAPARGTILIHGPDAPPGRADALRGAGVRCIAVPRGPDGRLSLAAALQALGALGMTRAMCEGGGIIAAALLSADLADELVWVSAGTLIGAEGLPGVGPLHLSRLADAPRFERAESRPVGDDLLSRWVRRR